MAAPLPASVVREFVADMKNFIGPARTAKGEKRRSSDDLRCFCAVCHEEADLALHPAPNVYCRNRACAQVGKKQMGGENPKVVCIEATPEGKAASFTPDSATADETTMRSLSAHSLALLMQKYKDTIKGLHEENDAIMSKLDALEFQLCAAERESNLRSVDALRAKIDLTKPARPTLVKLLSLVREYGKLFDRHPISKVKYDGEAVTCERGRWSYREKVEIACDGRVTCNGSYNCNLVSDHPRDWKL